MPYVEGSDGIELYIKEWGEGDPVVLIHGWPLNADSWDGPGARDRRRRLPGHRL